MVMFFDKYICYMILYGPKFCFRKKHFFLEKNQFLVFAPSLKMYQFYQSKHDIATIDRIGSFFLKEGANTKNYFLQGKKYLVINKIFFCHTKLYNKGIYQKTSYCYMNTLGQILTVFAWI